MRKVFILTTFILFISMFAFAQSDDAEKSARDYIRDGWQLMSEEELAKAQTAFQSAVDLEPENTEALRGLGKAAMYLGDHQKAEELFKKVLELKPRDIDTITLLATLYSWEGRYDESTEWYEQVLQQEPRYAKAHKGLAEVYMWDNRLEKAEDIYLKALDMWPKNIELRLGLAKTYSWMGAWSRAAEEYEEVLRLEPGNAAALEGIKEGKRALIPQQDFSFRYIGERDTGDWRAHTYTYGYKHTKLSDYGNSFYGAYYFDYFQQSDRDSKIGNTAEFGGAYNYKDFLTVLSSVNFRTYIDDPAFFTGLGINAILKYYENNTLSFQFSRNLFDVLDNVRSGTYGVESNIYLTSFLLLTDTYFHSFYSDSNDSTDTFHNLTFLILKKKPDFNLSIGYRWRDFDDENPNYYSPQDLETITYSAFLGNTFKNSYVYGLFKFNQNSDSDNEFYYLAGCDYTINDIFSITGEISYFDTEGDYDALFATVSLKARF